MRGYKILSWTALIISLFLLVLPRIAPICIELTKMGTPMQCYYAYQAEFVITLLTAIVSASLFVLRSIEARRIIGFIIALFGISIIVVLQPWAIGLCPNSDADCHLPGHGTTFGGLLLFVVGASIVWLSRKGE